MSHETHTENARRSNPTIEVEWVTMQDKFATLDPTSYARVEAEERHLPINNTPVSPRLQKLVDADQLPNSLRVPLFKRKQPESIRQESEVTEIRRKQMMTEQMIKSRLKSTSVPKQSAAFKLPQAPPKPKLNDSSPSEDSASSTQRGFHPNRYVMRHEPNFLQDQFRKDFYDFMHVSRKKINQKLAELVHVQVADALQNHYHIEVPELFKDNITHFASLLVKSKKLQGIFADFTDQVAQVLNYEIVHQKTFIQDYLQVPRLKGESGFFGKPYIPNIGPKTKEAFTVFAKAKDYIKQVQHVKHQEQKEQQLQQQKKEKMQQKLKSYFQSKINEKIAENKPLLLPIQETLLERVNAINQQAQLIEENAIELENEVLQAEQEMTETKGQRGRKPGAAISHLLERWHDTENWINHEEMRKYANELWLTREEFEQQLKEQQTALKIELSQKTAAYVARVDSIRSNASFQIEALEAALTETKLKAARDVERAEMRLAEMESNQLRKHKDDQFVKQAVKQAQDLLTVNESVKADPELTIRQMRETISQLLETNDSLNSEKAELNKLKQELLGTLAKDKAFNDRVQAEARKSKEMLIYYQMLVHDLLARTKVFESDGASSEDRVLFSEILQLNGERLRQDEEDVAMHGHLEPRRTLQRLVSYCDDIHKLFTQLDFKSVFDTYHRAIEEKGKIVQALALELSDLGLILQSSINLKTNEIKIEDLIRESDLRIFDRKNVDPSFQRFVPKRKDGFSVYEDTKNFAPIGIVRPERKTSIHTLIEQLLLPNYQRVHLIVERDRQVLEERKKAVIASDRRRWEQEEEAKKVEKLKAEGMMEAQHFEIAKEFGKPAKEDKKKLADQIQVKQKNRAKVAESLEKAKIATKKKETAVKTTKPIQKTAEPSQAKKGESSLDKPASSQPANQTSSRKPSKSELSSNQIQSQYQTKAEPNKKSEQSQKLKAQPTQQKPVSQNDSFSKERQKSVAPSKPIEVSIVPEDPSLEDMPTTQRFSPNNQLEWNQVGQIEPVQNLTEKVVADKYSQLISKHRNCDVEDLQLNNKEFDLLYDTFKQSLGQDITSKDYLDMFAATNVDSFIEHANCLQQKYLHAAGGHSGLQNIPFTDLIMTDVDEQGQFCGLKIRQDLAKVWYLENNKDASKLARLVKLSNQINRMLLEPDADYNITARKTVKDVKTVSTECNLIETIEKVVVKEVIVNQPAQVEKPTTDLEIPVIKEFFEMVKKHCIEVLMRETPDDCTYYKIVWAKQTTEQLLNYKLPFVFDEVPEQGINLDELDPSHAMTVSEYFSRLFKLLGKKLLMNVPREEKKYLDLSKWIWAGDRLEIPNLKETASQTTQKKEQSSSCQTDPSQGKDWLKLPQSCFQSRSSSSSSRARDLKHVKTSAVQTDFEKLDRAREESIRISTSIKEQIDEMMSEEISKTIASMQMFVDQVKYARPQRAAQTVQTEPTSRNGSVLKQQMHQLRNDLNYDTQQMLDESNDMKFQHASPIAEQMTTLMVPTKSCFKKTASRNELPELTLKSHHYNLSSQNFSQKPKRLLNMQDKWIEPEYKLKRRPNNTPTAFRVNVSNVDSQSDVTEIVSPQLSGYSNFFTGSQRKPRNGLVANYNLRDSFSKDRQKDNETIQSDYIRSQTDQLRN